MVGLREVDELVGLGCAGVYGGPVLVALGGAQQREEEGIVGVVDQHGVEAGAAKFLDFERFEGEGYVQFIPVLRLGCRRQGLLHRLGGDVLAQFLLSGLGSGSFAPVVSGLVERQPGARRLGAGREHHYQLVEGHGHFEAVVLGHPGRLAFHSCDLAAASGAEVADRISYLCHFTAKLIKIMRMPAIQKADIVG